MRSICQKQPYETMNNEVKVTLQRLFGIMDVLKVSAFQFSKEVFTGDMLCL